MVSRHKFIVDFNPRNGEILEKIKCSSAGEVASAVKLAKKAGKVWKNLPVKQKISGFKKILKDFEKDKFDIAKLISLETGKTEYFSIKEIEESIKLIEHFLSFSSKGFENQKLKVSDELMEVSIEPIGICAVITGWRNPIKTSLAFLIPNILCGNTVVFKPSEFTPLCGKRIHEIINRYLPKGVITILQGVDEVVESLIDSDIDIIGFSGRVETGKKIKFLATKNLLPVITQLYKKDIIIILNDADLKKASISILEHCFVQGLNQKSEFNKIYVEEKISGKFKDKISLDFKKLKFHNVPFISDEKRNYIVDQIIELNRKGVKTLFGGNKVNSHGYYLEPTILYDIFKKHQIKMDGCSGPMICLQNVSNRDELVEKLNSQNSIESVTIWTKSTINGIKISRKLKAGTIYLNKIINHKNNQQKEDLNNNRVNLEQLINWGEKFYNKKVLIYNK